MYKNVSHDIQSYKPVFRSVDLHFGRWMRRKSIFSEIGHSRSMIGVLIYFFWFLWISNTIHTNYHSFTLFPGLVYLRSGRKMNQKSFFVKIGGRFRLIYGPEWRSTDLKIDLNDWKSLETFPYKYEPTLQSITIHYNTNNRPWAAHFDKNLRFRSIFCP